MKFTVNKSDITEAVSNIQRAVSTKTSIPALEGILLSAPKQGWTCAPPIWSWASPR